MVHFNETGFVITVESSQGNSRIEDYQNLRFAIMDVMKYYRYEDFGSNAYEVVYPLINLLEQMDLSFEQITGSNLIDHCKPV